MSIETTECNLYKVYKQLQVPQVIENDVGFGL